MNNIRNILYGMLEILDGMILIATLGYVHTTLCFKFLAWWGRYFEYESSNTHRQREHNNSK